MDGVEDCPWGLLSLAGALAVLVVVPSQCVEAEAAAADEGDRRRGQQGGGGGGCCTLRGVVAGCRWIEVRCLRGMPFRMRLYNRTPGHGC